MNSVFNRDPFAYPEAENIPIEERSDFLQSYYVAYDGIEKVESLSHSTALLAPQGGGKTAARLKFENKIIEQQDRVLGEVQHTGRGKTSLAVTYNDFSHVVNYLPNINVEMHSKDLLSAIAEAVFTLIVRYPHIFLKCKLSQREWWWAFFDHHLQGERLIYRMRNSNFNNSRKLVKKYKDKTRIDPFVSDTSLANKLEIISKRLAEFHITSIYILVEGVDGYVQTSGAESYLPEMIAPLLNTQSLLSKQNIYWKFFLPIELEGLVVESGGFKSGRLDQAHITWDSENLSQLLTDRLRWGSSEEKPIKSLSSIYPYPQRLDDELISMALLHKYFGAPKALLELASELIKVYEVKGIEEAYEKQWEQFVFQNQQFLNPESSKQEDYKKSILAVVNVNREIIGTAFIVSLDNQSYPHRHDYTRKEVFVLTCAHVVKQCDNMEEITLIPFDPYEDMMLLEVVKNCAPTNGDIEREKWRAGEDIAILKVEILPNGLLPLTIKATSEWELHRNRGRAYWGFGYEKTRKLRGVLIDDIAIGEQVGQGFWEIIPSEEEQILPGMSGIPLADNNGEIVGMVQSSYSPNTAYIIPVSELYSALFKLSND